MSRSTKHIFILIVLINLLVIARFFLGSRGGMSDNDKRSLFLSAKYDDYLDTVSRNDPDPDMKYWRVLAHIYNADLQSAKDELAALDFSHYSATALDLLQVLNKLQDNEISGAIKYMDSRPVPYNIRERAAKNQLYTLALLRQSKRNVRALNIEIDEIKKNNANARFTKLLEAAIRVENRNFKGAFQQFLLLDQQKTLQEPLFREHLGRAAHSMGEYEKALEIFEYLEKLPTARQGFFAVNRQSFVSNIYTTLYHLERYEESLDEIDRYLLDSSLSKDEIRNALMLKSRNYKAMGQKDLSWEYLMEANSHTEGHINVLYDMITHHELFPDPVHKDFIQRFTSQYIDKYNADKLMKVYRLRTRQGESDEAERVRRFVMAKYPSYEPARIIDRKIAIEKFVLYWLRDEADQLEQAETDMVAGFGLDTDTNIVLATHRLDQADEAQALRYGQIAANNISVKNLDLYLMVFLGYFQQDRVWENFATRESQIEQDAQLAYEAQRDLYLTGDNYLSGDAVYSGDVLIQDLNYKPAVSDLARAYMKRWLAYQTGRDNTKSQALFEIEALRGQFESLMDEDVEPLFKRNFARYYNFRDKYFKAPEEESDELEEE